MIDRQRQLRALLELETIVAGWSSRLGQGDRERVALLRDYFRTIAQIQVGLVRELHRGWLSEGEILVVVDEFAESLRSVRRPPLSPGIERRVRHDLSASAAGRA